MTQLTLPIEKAIRYHPEAIAQKYRYRRLEVGRRLWFILLTVIGFILGLWWDSKTGKSIENQQRRAIRLRDILSQLGPAYIKIGQALSTRPDLLPRVYLDELAKLQDQLPPFDNKLAYQFIQEELGGSPKEIYAELTASPIAAASLGQVYKGKLKTGEIVAVKVQRPDLAEKIALDIYILRGLADWGQKQFKGIRSNLVPILDEFASRLFEEMDYIQEGQNAEKFASLYSNIPDVYVPKIYWEYTNRRVLTMEWITGTKLTFPDKIEAQGVDARHLVEVGVQCTLLQLLEHGFFHADPHPGNLLATPDGKLVYLDFGMMSYIQPYQRYGLINAVVHIVNRDFAGLVEDYIQLDFLPPDVDAPPVRAALKSLFDEALTATIAELNFQVIVQKLSELMYEYKFQVPAYYALIIRSLVALEGIAMGIDPDFKVLMCAYPYVAKRLLTDPAPELRTSLTNLLFKDGSFRWNRLERLLSNARNSSDYNLNSALEQGVNFLFSERGEFIRVRLADELVKTIDTLGESLLEKTTAVFGFNFGSKKQNSTAVIDPQTLDYLKNILVLLQDSPGFKPTQLAQVIVKVIMKPEAYQTGQYVVTKLLERGVERILGQLTKEAVS